MQERVAVGRRLGRRLGADHAAGAAAVLDDELLAEGLAELVGPGPGDDVGGAAGRERHDDLDIEKTTELLERRYYWPTLKKDVKGYVDGCGACQRGKGKHQNTGLYMPLPVPKAPWEHISMDFVMGLPMTARKKNAILVVVDRFSKMAHFVACAEQVNAVKCADLVYTEVVRLHGLPLTITSDRDGRFMSAFWKTLWKRVGTKLNFSSSFHPQMDGQTEVVNRSVGNMLRCLVGERLGNWDLMLAQAEFAYNSSVNRSTGMSPFQIVYGRLPIFPADISFQAIEKESEEANRFVKDRA